MKVLIWMDIPSHHQSFFFDECYKLLGAGFKVIYYNQGVSEERRQQGWNSDPILKPYEAYSNSPQAILNHSEFIHIIPGEGHPFTKALIDLCIQHGISWCHWSESSGVRLMKILNFNVFLYEKIAPLFFKIAKRKYAKKINQFALGAFAQGEMAENNFLSWGVHKDKIKHLYYAVPALTPFKDVDCMKEFIGERKLFLCSAKLCKRKGIDLLIKAFASLNKRGWCLVFLGQKDRKGQYQSLVNKLGLESDIFFTGAVSVDLIANYVNYADVFVLPTRYDGWGVVVNEVSSLGTPIISTTQCGAARHLIEDGKNGFCVKAGSVKALASAMQNYIERPCLIDKHGRHSKALFTKVTPAENAKRLVHSLVEWGERCQPR